MGGYSQPRCETALWRGHRVCKHSIPKLDAWAKGTGSAFRVQPIQGCYSTSVAASANTHAGGGVYDVECDGYALSVSNAAVNDGRKVLLVTFGRWWNGNHHIHLIDPECPDLDPSAEEQMEQFRRGETGLVGVDRDPWDRSTKDAIFRVYDSRHDVKAPAPGKHRTYTIPKGGTLGAAAIALGVTVGALASFNRIPDPNVVRPGQVVTAPPSGYSAPAPKPAAPKPAPAPAKPKPKPVVKPKPKPVVKAAPKATNGFRPIASQRGAYLNLLKVGSKNSTSVYRYEQALARKGYLSWTWASDGYYGTATAAATKAAYKRLGVTPWATTPGPYLLKHLGVGVVR